jgi:hypothetical protein
MEDDRTRSAWLPHSYENIYDIQECYESVVMSSQMVDQTSLPPALRHKERFAVAGHCRYATALHGRYRGQIFCQHQRSSDSDELRSGETVRALLTHSDNDPLQQIGLYV